MGKHWSEGILDSNSVRKCSGFLLTDLQIQFKDLSPCSCWNESGGLQQLLMNGLILSENVNVAQCWLRVASCLAGEL